VNFNRISNDILEIPQIPTFSKLRNNELQILRRAVSRTLRHRFRQYVEPFIQGYIPLASRLTYHFNGGFLSYAPFKTNFSKFSHSNIFQGDHAPDPHSGVSVLGGRMLTTRTHEHLRWRILHPPLQLTVPIPSQKVSEGPRACHRWCGQPSPIRET